MRVSVIRGAIAAFVMATAASAAQAALTLDVSGLTGANYRERVPLTLIGAPPGAYGHVELEWDMPRLRSSVGFSQAAQNAFVADAPTQFPGWTFTEAAAEVFGMISVTRYTAEDIDAVVFGRGGAQINATYMPAAGDPPFLAWVSYYADNLGGPRAHIDPFPNDDVGEQLPFYYNTSAEEGISRLDFSDAPSDRVSSIPFYRYVFFETYLVGYDPAQIDDGAAGGQVSVYGGFEWGYVIVANVPEPGTLMLLVVGIAGVLLVRSRPAARCAD
ncbi:MAG: PEP-CTERM sorting domain-containing protein [Acetobacteraceae bacterium]|jgi:hypothetical protein|nr:PEP-CTERM sorting domain-containing protein [Acetobacteraceae bacterium]